MTGSRQSGILPNNPEQIKMMGRTIHPTRIDQNLNKIYCKSFGLLRQPTNENYRQSAQLWQLQ